MRTISYQLAATLLIATLCVWQYSIDQTANATSCDSASCDTCCPNCKLKIDEKRFTKHCYDVECKTICIPRATFPWQKGCKNGCDAQCSYCPTPLNGAKTKTVRVLKKFEYECQRCQYKWTPGCGNGDCGCDAQVRADGRYASVARLSDLQAVAQRDVVLPVQHTVDSNVAILATHENQKTIKGGDSETAVARSRLDWLRAKVMSYIKNE